MKRLFYLPLFVTFFISPLLTWSQKIEQDSLPNGATLQQCVEYALKHQPLIHQSQIDEEITENNIKNEAVGMVSANKCSV